MAHTPGPWRLRTTGIMANCIEGFSGQRYDRYDDGYRILGSFQACCNSMVRADMEANARANGHLMATAPKLLERCEHAAAVFEDYARMHREKGTSDGNAKAERNEEYAVVLRAVIAEARGTVP